MLPVCCRATMTASTTAPASTSRLMTFWPGNRNDFLMMPCSLAKAIMLPLKLTEPMSAPMMPRTAKLVGMVSGFMNSTAAISAAAPPPMPL